MKMHTNTTHKPNNAPGHLEDSKPVIMSMRRIFGSHKYRHRSGEKVMRSVGVAISLIMALAGAAFGQSTGTIAGNVSDQTGAVLPGVSVTVSSPDTGLTRDVLTNDRGDYVIPLLPVGTYAVKAELSGFQAQIREQIVVQVEQRLTINFDLTLGAVSEKVVVSEAAPLVDAETSSVGSVIENRRIVELPLNGREFQSLALLVPGAMPPTPGSTEIAYGAITMAGSRDTATAFSLDGMDMADGLVSRPAFKPSVDMIQEFKVQVSTYSAEYGRSSGGHVQVTTKSGTNDLHGTLFEFLRNDKLDAKNYFDDPSRPIPPFKRNNFGGSIGGPIVRDETFFFANYEGLRLRQALTRTATVPITPMVRGDFSSLDKPIIDPFTGFAFPGNVIPTDRINLVGLNIARMFPAPNLPGTTRNLVSTPIDNKNVHQFTGKIDHRFSSRDTFYGRYTFADDKELDPFDAYQGITNLPGYGRQDNQRAHNLSVVDTHVFSPALVAELRVGFNRYSQRRTQEDTSDVPGRLGIPGTTKDPNNTGDPAIRITGFDIIGKAGAFPSDRKDSTYQTNASITYTRGEHTIKFGAEFARFASPNLQNGGNQGDFTFDGGYTGNGLADVLLGFPRRTSVSSGDTENPLYRNTYAAFLQDDWKATPRLTLNLGLRYDLFTPVVSASNRMSRFDPDTGTIEIAGTPGVRRDISRPDYPGGPAYNPDLEKLAQTVTFVNIGNRSVYNLDHNDFAPRIGLAYRASGTDRLVVRAGYGIFYSFLYLNSGGLSIGRNYPFKISQTFNANATRPNLSIDNPFPSGLGAATISPVSISKDFHTGYVQEYNFGLQYQPLKDLVVDVSYVGNKATKLERSRNVNQPYPSLVGSIASRRPFPTFGNISLTESASSGHFDSLQMRVERRYSAGLTLLTAYTWSKAIDDAVVQGTLQRGPASYDARHRLVFSYIYELPIGSGKRFLANTHGVTNVLLKGWGLSGITTFQSGRPFGVTTSQDISNTGGGDRPNLISDPNLPRGQRTVDHWFNTAAFQLADRGTFGNEGRNVLVAPGLNNWDVSLLKNTQVREGKNLQFRAEVFNIANHPQFAAPNSDFSSPQFGKIFATTQFSRQIQLGLKLVY